MKTALPYIITVCTLTHMWLVGNKVRTAWLFGIAIQIVWVIFDIVFGFWPMLVVPVALTAVYLRNYRKLAVEEIVG